MVQAEFAFTLPRGYVDEAGRVHRNGRIRLATAFDEITTMQDARVRANAYYLPVVLLSRVVVALGEVTAVTPAILERLYASDLTYLQELYMHYNGAESVVLGAICPFCHEQFNIQTAALGA